jgi:hypothetical protein
MKGALSILLIGILLIGSIVSQMSPVFGEPKSNKQNEKSNQNILEFSSGTVLLASSTTTICHVPPGNHNNAHMITIGTSSLTAHINHGDKPEYCADKLPKIQEFASGSIEPKSDTLTKAEEIIDKIVLATTSDSKVGPAISQAAQLHQLFAHEDKETKKKFQKLFLDALKKIKENTKNGQGAMEKKILNELGKTAIKINSQIEKDERKEDQKNKVKTAIKLTLEKEELQEIRNQIAMAKINHDEDTDEFEELVDAERKILKKVLISEAKSKGEKITLEKINEIDEKTSEIVNNNQKTKSEKGNYANDKGNGSNDKSDKGNGSNDKSDKGNNKSDKKSQKSSSKSKGKNK